MLDEAGGGGEGHVGGDGGDDDDFEFGGVDAAAGEADFGCFKGQIAGGYALVDDVALANAGALGDPLVVGGDHLFEVGVGEQMGRNEGSYRRNLGADGDPRLQRQTQTTTSQSKRAADSILSRTDREVGYMGLPAEVDGRGNVPGFPTAPVLARYRCFLPDLAGLAGIRRVGPGTGVVYHCALRRVWGCKRRDLIEFRDTDSGCGAIYLWDIYLTGTL